jgi:thiamine biosynthesis lipoprotein
MIRCQAILGTFVEIQTLDPGCSNAQASAAIASAFEAIKLVETLMSAYSATSDLSRINAQAHQQTITVHPWVWEVIALSKDLYLQSEGLFNVGIGHVLAEKGLRPVFANHARPTGDIADIALLEKFQIRSDKPVHLDLGGIAKGFAVDRAVDALLAHGISQGVVNAGGDMRVFGAMAHPIKVRSPRDPYLLLDMGSLTDGALATSANYFTPLEKEDRPIGHMVRSQTQELENSPASFSVVAPLCVLADALTKVFMLSGDAQHPCITHYQAQAFQVSA